MLAALQNHEVYDAFDHCQPEQDAVETAQEGQPIPVAALNRVWQQALDRLATATTRCLNGVGTGRHHDLTIALRNGVKALPDLRTVKKSIH